MTIPYAAPWVTSLTAKEVDETYFILSHLESVATGLAAASSASSRKAPERLATSQEERRGIMAALRRHDTAEVARLALLHKRSVRDDVSTLVDSGE